jgi:glycosyltransferase involved in cell wall biosynthesis
VSVVLPVWNGDRFLAEAIESIRRQTLESFELLVLDDGSTDRSRAIAEEHARADARVKVIALEHGGLVRALNTGIERASAHYIARMDADDVALPARFEKQVAFLDANPRCLVVGSDMTVVDEEGEPVGVRWFPRSHPEIVQALMNGVSPLGHPAVMMRRSAVLEAGGYREDHFPSEDLDLWLRLCDAGELVNLPEQLLRYRRHTATICIRERHRQPRIATAVVDAARRAKGLAALGRRIGAAHNVQATYHHECARTALISGRRRAALKHARLSIASAPLWPQPYVTLAAAVVPYKTLKTLLKVYGWLRARRLGSRRAPEGAGTPLL